MNEAIIAALITGVCSVIAVIFTNIQSNKRNEIKTAQQMETIKQQMLQQEQVFNLKIDELTREVRLHNNFAQRVPVIENEISNLKHKVNNMP